jgi:glutathione-regulated potassium-efflux system ancillary protein KefC
MEHAWLLGAVWGPPALVAVLLANIPRISTALSEIVAGTVAQLAIGAVRRFRTVTFGLLTPFYFIRAGSFVSVPALIAAPSCS